VIENEKANPRINKVEVELILPKIKGAKKPYSQQKPKKNAKTNTDS